MLRISKLTDYGTVVLGHLAQLESAQASASEIAAATGVGLPTVSKLLKNLAKAGLVKSTRGAQGGYRLAREAADISAAEVIDALEGPVSITECSGDDSHCGIEAVCNVGNAWQRINVAIRRALQDVSLDDLKRANAPTPLFNFVGTPINVERKDK
ncbi:MAG: SUF system Fe-S cluster assembly regulator [Woeseia sp.]|nr:SUF system Fe-S cluster assembly regulator [Woeseia sp.]MBT8097237.1 SUF system Fe-S cluster assembly regulator [Woeseia sp.]NNE59301.1 SUF system Fe-S cluster assembly regulator [Woeseia sp.]NNL55439.1 SUF system Fe-S cluster assembly regulator [Woeseia sp.]